MDSVLSIDWPPDEAAFEVTKDIPLVTFEVELLRV